jgi:hypothetical protein
MNIAASIALATASTHFLLLPIMRKPPQSDWCPSLIVLPQKQRQTFSGNFIEWVQSD